MSSNTSTNGAGYSNSHEYSVYDALPDVVKRAFQNAPADFSAAALVAYPPAVRARRTMTDDEYADWLEEQFILTYRHNILPETDKEDR